MKPKKTKKRILSKRYSILLALICSCSMTVFVYLKFIDVYPQEPFQVLDDGRVHDFLVDTPGCRIPSWDPWDDSVKPYYEAVRTYRCVGDPSFLVVKPNAVIILDDTLLQLYYEVPKEIVRCTYRTIERDGEVSDFTVDKKFKLGLEKPLRFGIPLKDEFIRTECAFPAGGKGANLSFTEYIPLTPLKEPKTATSPAKKKKKPKRFNVIFLGIDSISNLNFQRHFPTTMKYLQENLSPITLKGYTKVGDNTFPNLVPLLTGHFYDYYWDESANRTMYFDDLPFLWKEYSKAGYTTLLAEDAPDIATFNYLRSGFKSPPTDYYYRPFALAVEQSPIRTTQCFGSKMEMQVVYDYLKSFVQTMNDSRPFFAFVFTARLTHDVFNYAGYADKPAFHLLRFLHESGVLNNTLLVFYSDHGIRYTEVRKTFIGQFEERMPFMHLVFPKRFLERKKVIARNLRTNEKRLTTPFDIHATLMDFLNIDSVDIKEESVLEFPGISLFHEVSPHRTCEHASISPHWCTCQVQKKVALDEAVVVRAAKAIVLTVNQWTKHLRAKCSPLVLQKIHMARVSGSARATETSNVTSSSTYIDYLVVVSTMPGSGMFEATVRCDQRTTCKVMDDISRINRYYGQSDCIENSVLKKFCYCYFNAK